MDDVVESRRYEQDMVKSRGAILRAPEEQKDHVSEKQPKNMVIKITMAEMFSFAHFTGTLKVWNMWRTWLKCGMNHRLSSVLPSADNSCCSSSTSC